MKLLLLTWIGLLSHSTLYAAVTFPVAIDEKGISYRGDLIVPDSAKESKKALPLVVVIHEWWGKTSYPLGRAKQIADDLGYAALVVDLYGDGKTTETAQEAQSLSTPFYQDPMKGVSRLRQFIEAGIQVGAHEKISLDSKKTAAIGYCFGGTQALNLARAGIGSNEETLAGVVSFHGGLASSLHAKSKLRTHLLVLHGADDSFVKPAEVAAFKKEIKKAHAHLNFVSYPGATHAFSNPNATEMGKKNKIPIAYNAEAATGSWKEMTKFLKAIFGS